jgi:hypothetical protein
VRLNVNKVLRIFGFVFVAIGPREYRANNAKQNVKLMLTAPDDDEDRPAFPWWVARLEIIEAPGDSRASMQTKFASTRSPAAALDGLLKAAARFGARLRDEANRADGIRGDSPFDPVSPPTKLLCGDTYPIRRELRALGGEWDNLRRGWHIPTGRWAEALRLQRAHRDKLRRIERSSSRGYAICYSSGRDGEEIIRDLSTKRRLTRVEAAQIIRRGGKLETT